MIKVLHKLQEGVEVHIVVEIWIGADLGHGIPVNLGKRASRLKCAWGRAGNQLIRQGAMGSGIFGHGMSIALAAFGQGTLKIRHEAVTVNRFGMAYDVQRFHRIPLTPT